MPYPALKLSPSTTMVRDVAACALAEIARANINTN
jgi:hypothetical protein